MRDCNDTPTGPLRAALGRVQAALFLAAIAVPGLVTLFDGGNAARVRDSMAEEFRTPAPPPPPLDSLDHVVAFPGAFDAWWNDHFGFRTTLIRWHNIIKLFGFGVAPSDRVVVGRTVDDTVWLDVNLHLMLDDYRRLIPLTDEELRAHQRYLEQQRDLVASWGGRYLFVVAPNKCTVYPERMPARLTRLADGSSRLDQFVAWMAAHSTVPVLDLRPAIQAAKAEHFDGLPDGQLLYYPLGTHWTDLGAWVGYRELARTLGLRPNPLSAFRVRQLTGEGDSWAKRFHIADLLPQRFADLWWTGSPRVRQEGVDWTIYVTLWTSEAPERPVGVLLRDSFGDALGPLLAPHFSKLLTVWNQTGGPEVARKVLDATHPPIVIELVVERFFTR